MVIPTENLPPQLPEKDFIHEEYGKNPYPYWIWLFLATVVVAVLWGGKSWFSGQIQEQVSSSPFLQVTNREMSLFLWQNTQYMRANSGKKSNYLPAFQYLDKVTVEPDLADQIVVAPPELIFQYHVWQRLLSDQVIPTPIPRFEFQEFLSYAEEWQPRFWPKAPPEYVKFVSKLQENQILEADLQNLAASSIPKEVRLAFQGWENYFRNGEKINRVKPTFGKMQVFITAYPHYARNYWKNIVEETTPRYLYTLTNGKVDPDAPIPNNEMSPLLKAAFYNSQQVEGKRGPYLIIGPSK